jgi:hypothetical protein
LAAASIAPAPRRGALLPGSPFSVLALASALAPVATVAATSMVNKVLAGLRITPRFVFAVCLPGVQTNCAGLSPGKQGANMTVASGRRSLPEFSRAGIINLVASSRFFVALGLQEAIKAQQLPTNRRTAHLPFDCAQ